jgi:NAD(P)-dependent dehydrogenase (short-subunit alcohol dehydrogenase family)
MTVSLKGKLALITGAGRGIGRGIALVLAEQGAALALNDLPGSPELAATVSEVAALGAKVQAFSADVSTEEGVRSLFGDVERACGPVDLLVNNAGVSQAKDIFALSLEEWNRVLTINLTSCFLCSKYALERMKPRQSGRIVNISSVVGHQGALYGHVHYAASKSGMLGFTKTLARTAAPFGVTVNAVAPGIIDTELLQNTLGNGTAAKLAQEVPLGLGTVRDVGLAVAFLCGEGGRYITGTTLDVNGGLYLR